MQKANDDRLLRIARMRSAHVTDTLVSIERQMQHDALIEGTTLMMAGVIPCNIGDTLNLHGFGDVEVTGVEYKTTDENKTTTLTIRRARKKRVAPSELSQAPARNRHQRRAHAARERCA